MEFLKQINIDWKTTVIVICILACAIILTRSIRWFIRRYFEAESKKLRVDPTRYKFFRNAVSLIIWIIALAAIVSLIPRLKALAITLFAGAGILVAVMGFAAQQAFSNIIGGIFIVIFKPFRVGDLIKVGTLDYGTVEDITLRHTVIRNFQNKRIIIPNSVIGSDTIVNDSIEDPKVCRWVEVGISYDSDVELATRIIQEEAIKHPSCIDARTEEEKVVGVPQVDVRLTSFDDFSLNLRAYVWADDPVAVFQMHFDINRAIKKRFDAEGVEIPFPYRTLVYKKDLPPNRRIDTDD